MNIKTVILGLIFTMLPIEKSAAAPPPLLPDTCSDYVCIKRGNKKKNGSYIKTVSKSIKSDEKNIRFLFEYDDNSRELISMSFPSDINGIARSWSQSSYELNILNDDVNPAFNICRTNTSEKDCIFVSYWSYKSRGTVDRTPCSFDSIWIKPGIEEYIFPIGSLLIQARIKQGNCTYNAIHLSKQDN